MPEMILQRVLRCQSCHREMQCPPLEYEEHPLCTVCLPARMKQATPAEGVRWRREGSYFVTEAAVRIRPSGAVRRRRP